MRMWVSRAKEEEEEVCGNQATSSLVIQVKAKTLNSRSFFLMYELLSIPLAQRPERKNKLDSNG